MENYNDSQLRYETESFENNRLSNQSEILLTSISLLEEQIRMNKSAMEEIVAQLKQKEVEFTYSDNGKLNIVCNMDDVEAINSDPVHLMITSYNVFQKKNTNIEQNICDIKRLFLRQLNEDTMDEISEEIEKKGISILEAQETERSRIACDLHDSIIQNLTNLVHKTELCIKTIDRDTIGVKLDLQFMMQNLKIIINDIRSIIYNLRPMAFEDLGINIAIERFLNQFEQMNKVGVKFENTCTDNALNTSVVSLTLFRIIQEACSNAVKHGNASSIKVNISNDDCSIILWIQDNGTGFDIKKESTKVKTDNSGFGLSIMKERIYLLSGNINIDSSRERGTQIIVKIPIVKC